MMLVAAATLAVAGGLAAVSLADSGYPTYPSQASSTLQLTSGGAATATSQPGAVTPNAVQILTCSAPASIGSNAQHTQLATFIFVSHCSLNGVVLTESEWAGTSSIFLYYLNRANKQWTQIASTRGLAESPGSTITRACGAGISYKSLVSATVTSFNGVVANEPGVVGPITC
jgi:hypothetical protein